jgi:hypothetical protein
MKLRNLIVGALLAAACSLGFGQTLMSGATATGAGTAQALNKNSKTFQAVGTTSSGSGSVTVAVQCSLDGTNYDTIGTITLTLSTTPASNSFTSADRCNWHRGNVTAISGTGASVSLFLGM